MKPETKSKTQQALDWLAANPGRPASEAARVVGISQSAISHAIRAARKPRCACCGQTLTRAKVNAGSARPVPQE